MSNNIDLTYAIDADIPDMLIGDPLRLCQVLTNLVGNAIKFTSPKGAPGRVAVDCHLLALNNETGTVTLECCVSDTGIGTAKDKLSSILNKDLGGTHLGLFISKGIIDLMQGRMWAESEFGESTNFFFTITSQIGQVSHEATVVKMRPYVNRTVLFLDTLYDNTGVNDVMLELGVRPCVIRDSFEVADKTTTPYIDVIVVDSLQAVETIREHEHLRHIPIILLMPNIPRLNLKWCLDNSISGAVATPVSTADFASTLVGVLESNTPPIETETDKTFNILLTEDNVVNQNLATKILEKYGHEVTIAENGAFAVEKFKQGVETKPFDIILMDVEMPVMDGIEATLLIRKYEIDFSLQRTPIIALLAHAAIEDRERCIEVGMDDYTTKPLRRTNLVNSIRRLTQSSRISLHRSGQDA